MPHTRTRPGSIYGSARGVGSGPPCEDLQNTFWRQNACFRTTESAEMDIHAILDNKITSLPLGIHLDGLRAVKSHIDAAVRHLTRGQKESDESLFTDSIYRCNQAFEGSLKEAYRVLAGEDPQKTTPADIEKFS